MNSEDALTEPFWLDYLPAFAQAKLKNRKNLHKAMANMGWLMFDRALRMLAGLFIGLWVARYLGPGNFGVINYAAAFVGIFAGVSALGLDSIVVREMLSRPHDRAAIMGTAFVLKLAASCVSFLISVTAIYFMKSDALVRVAVVILSATMIFQSLDVIRFWFESQVQSKYVVIVQNAAFLVLSAVKIVLLLQKASVIWFVWLMLLDVVLGAVGLAVYYHALHGKINSWKFSVSEVPLLLRDSWPLMLSGIAIAIYMRIDQIMLGNMLGNSAVGTYSAAVRISEVWYFIPIFICRSIYPSLIEAKKQSEEKYLRRFQQLFRLMVYITLPIAIIVSFFARYVVLSLYGIQYLDAAKVLSVHIWTGVFVFWGVAGGYFYIIEGLSKILFYRSLYGVIVNILLNLFLIPLWGGVGAAISTLVAYSVQSYFSELFNPATRVIFKLKTKALFGLRSAVV